jgi:hypothetical protein
MDDFERKKGSARLLVARLERLSADSYWAHQASGLRGSLLRSLERIDSSKTRPGASAGELSEERARLEDLVGRGYKILTLAARAMRSPAGIRK